MLKYLASFLAAMLLALPVGAQAVTLPSEIKVKANRPVKLIAVLDGDDIQWDIDPALEDFSDLLDSQVRRLFWTPSASGTYTVKAWTAKVVGGKAKLSPIAVCKIVVEGVDPPKPPPDPKPPGPKPPDPKPDDNAPIPEIGFRVLFIIDKLKHGNLMPGQEIRQYLEAKCVAGPDGRTKEWRLYDHKDDVVGESDTWKKAMARQRKSLPWLIVSNGRTGYEGPLPATVQETMTILRKHGGE